MKKLIIVAALAASFSSAAFDALPGQKAALVASTLERVQDMPIDELCRIKGSFAYDVEGTAPDSVERAIDFGMVGAHAILSRHWTQEQRDDCTKIEMQAWYDAQNLAEGEE